MKMNTPYKKDYQLYDCIYFSNKRYPERCPWRGLTSEMLDHFKEKHPECITNSSFVSECSVPDKNGYNMLTVAFDMVFLINMHVCLNSQKVYYCVRLLTDGNIENYSYEVVVENYMTHFGVKGVVAPPGCLTNLQGESIEIKFDRLRQLFGSTTFKIVLISSIDDPITL